MTRTRIRNKTKKFKEFLENDTELSQDSKNLLFVNEIVRRLGHRINPWRTVENRRQTTCKRCYCPIYFGPSFDLAHWIALERILSIQIDPQFKDPPLTIVNWEADLPSVDKIVQESLAVPDVFCKHLRVMI